MKILVLRFSSIGDIVLTTPVLRGIHKQLGADLHYATKAQYLPLLEANPYLKRIYVLKNSLWALATQLRKERYDYIIDLHHNLRTFVLKKMLGVQAYSFYKLNLRKWLYVHFKWPPLPALHVVDRYWRTVAPLGVEPDAEGLDYFIPVGQGLGPEVLPPAFHKGYVAYAIGGKWATKKLPLQQMIQLCDKINRPVLLLGGPEDATQGAAIADVFAGHRNTKLMQDLQILNKHTQIYNGCGRFSLHEAASLLRAADCVFSHDTGMMHIAAAFKKPIVSIWCSTVPAFGMYPYRTHFTVLERRGLSCRPCSKIGYAHCPKGHARCMQEIPMKFSLPM